MIFYLVNYIFVNVNILSKLYYEVNRKYISKRCKFKKKIW